MICPKCNQEMRKGYLFSNKDGAFSFADEVPGVFTNARTAKGFVEITSLKASHRTKVEACICENCRIVEFEYYNKKAVTKISYCSLLFAVNNSFNVINKER